MKSTCVDCGSRFELSVAEENYFTSKNLVLPKRCRPCRKNNTMARRSIPKSENLRAGNFWLNEEKIMAFVNSIERKKNFKRDARLVFAHLVEEVGELSRALWEHEKTLLVAPTAEADMVAHELIDIVFLAAYLADILGVKIEKHIPGRMEAIREEYGVPEEDR